jgi:adenylate cyclase
MSDVFISYARSTEAQAHRIAEALRGLGYGVWRDDELPPHRSFAEVIEERLKAAKAVLVLWSAEAVKSEWVQSEADRARMDHKLVQLRLDGSPLPMPFDRIQCADLSGWRGEMDAPSWKKVLASIADLARGPATMPSPRAAHPPAGRRVSICVLPFANMSADPEQEYFSDGITEDIITDLSKVSAVSVVARNTAFTFKGRNVDVRELARSVGVTHVLEGSVRKSGTRVRITAQLIDGLVGDHVWAERYERDLDDIFVVQDEISRSIVTALKLKLLPEEKSAIERRGTSSAAAYDLYLMARKQVSLGRGSRPGEIAEVLRLSKAAVEVDPSYARAWALIGWAQNDLRLRHGRLDLDPLPAIEKALALDPALPESHWVRAGYLSRGGREEEALVEYETALRLDPDSFEANLGAGGHHYRVGDFKRSAEYCERAAALDETDLDAPFRLVSCCLAMGDGEGAAAAAASLLKRAEAAVAQDPSNGPAIIAGAFALATLGRVDESRAWARRALAVDPETVAVPYNLACLFSRQLKDADAALELLEPLAPRFTPGLLAELKVDPDFEPIREDPRFVALVAGVEARLAEKPADPAEASA